MAGKLEVIFFRLTNPEEVTAYRVIFLR